MKLLIDKKEYDDLVNKLSNVEHELREARGNQVYCEVEDYHTRYYTKDAAIRKLIEDSKHPKKEEERLRIKLETIMEHIHLIRLGIDGGSRVKKLRIVEQQLQIINKISYTNK